MLLARYLPGLPAIRGLMPANPTPSEVAIDDPYRGMARVGDPGQAETVLRPGGKARFGSMLVDVVTQGDYIDQGTPIEVIERHGNQVVVRKIT